MPTISRGHQIIERRQRAATQAPRPAPVHFRPDPDTTDLHLIQVRLNALERLTRLVEQGTLTLDEFRIEKSLVLRHTGGDSLLTAKAPSAKPSAAKGPPLARRLTGWRFLLLALAVGLGFSFWAQPEDTAAFLADAATSIAG